MNTEKIADLASTLGNAIAKQSKKLAQSAFQQLLVVVKTQQFQHFLIAGSIVAAVFVASGYVREDVARLERFTMPLHELQVSPPPNYLSARAKGEVQQLALPQTRFHAFDGRLIPTLEFALERLPWVDKVNSIRVEFPNKVRFSCSVLEPIALVDWRGSKIVVAEDGRQFPKSYLDGFDLNGSPALPLITGLKPIAAENEVLLSTLELVTRLRKQKMLSSSQIRQIDVSNVGGRVNHRQSDVVMKTVGGMIIEWGRLPSSGQLQVSFEDRVARLSELLKKKKVEEIESVSLRWNKTVFTQKVKNNMADLAQR